MSLNNQKEKNGWDTFRRSLPADIRCWRIENQLVDGMADVVGLNANGHFFWLENKALDDWPKRSDTLPLRRVFEKGQLPFLREIRSRRGHAYVLLRVDKQFYLLDPYKLDLQQATKDDLIATCISSEKPYIIHFLRHL